MSVGDFFFFIIHQIEISQAAYKSNNNTFAQQAAWFEASFMSLAQSVPDELFAEVQSLIKSQTLGIYSSDARLRKLQSNQI